jgi:hypothetical protein
MILLIYCLFDDGPQTLWKVGATDDDVRAIKRAMAGNPKSVIGIVCRATPGGADTERLIRAGVIRSVDVERA